MKIKSALGATITALLAVNSQAMEVITVHSQHHDTGARLMQIPAQKFATDTADWLDGVVGAGVNKNGPITGLAQYRGMFAQRINVASNGLNFSGAGPNSMDTPLSYTPAIIIANMDIYRGIAPVSAGIDTLGGAIDVNMRRAELDSPLTVNGRINAQDNGSGFNASLAGGAGNSQFAWLAYADTRNSDEQDAKERAIPNSDYQRHQYGVLTTSALNQGHLFANIHRTDTKQSGTAALPMDIDYIDTTRFELSGEHEISDTTLLWGVGFQDGEHGMDNYQQRALSTAQKARYTLALGRSTSLFAHIKTGAWLWGYDGSINRHDADITNPNNDAFFVENFNNVADDRHSLFTEYTFSHRKLNTTVGARLKYNVADADKVSSTMAMMMPAVATLQTRFNDADKSVSDTTFDVVINNRYTLNSHSDLSYGVAIKERAASYQARYLWLPMQATGGLADGKTYVGNINLKPETAYQANVGWSYTNERLSIKPQLFYQRIDNYIQGTPSEDSVVNMVAMMMSGQGALRFSNIDAHLYGADMSAEYQLSRQWQVNAQISYVRGKRSDEVNDDLYRISPLNGQLSAHYYANDYQVAARWRFAQSQTHVSHYNNELSSPGYGVVDVSVDYDINSHWQFNAAVNNLFDHSYAPHLNGINRVDGRELDKGQRLQALGRTLHLGVSFSL
ncbi:TonB-dependent receptor [Pseudoalteromonas ruthenica]|uniref:TonB-dependent receptor n=1 Tax=Pseudoalteromonas ruthenica TaxID=151081 RepID=UPI00110B06AF|nr:TonB-dependent receptor [Pseudoalteromonas ruthenica]